MIDDYAWAGGREAALRFGPAGNAPVVVVALPLLEEANRTRAFAVAVLRQLAARGVAGVLPDLPGTGESLREVERVRLADWRAAFAAATAAFAAGRPTFSFSIRACALVDTEAAVRGRCRLSPIDGATQLREFERVRAAAAREDRAAVDTGDAYLVAGNRLARAMVEDLRGATAEGGRVLRVEGDPRPADRHLPGTPLWRRAEPDTDAVLAAGVADYLADWIATCGG